jgi:hypothetical protein
MTAGKRNRHGHRALMVAIKTRDLRALDRRCAGYKALTEWKSEMIEALGGEANLTPQKKVIVDAIVRSKLFLDSLDAFLLSQKSVVNARRRAVLPALMQRQTLVDGLSRLLRDVGLERAQKRIPTIAEYVAEHDAKAKETV